MKTEELIRVMATDTVRQRALGHVLLIGLVPSLVVALAFVWLALGFRADLPTAMVTPVSLMRIVLAAGLGLSALRIAYLLSRPEGRQRARLWPFAVIAAVAGGLWGWTYLATPAEARQMAITGKTMVSCLTVIPMLSILPVAAILFTLRRGAATAPGLAGIMAGLAGSGLAAAVYALHCDEDSPLFYVTWYGLAILGVTLVSAILAPRLLRW